VEETEGSIIKTAHVDRRWVKIRRPTVVVGGELTMDSLEIRHDAGQTSAKRQSNSKAIAVAIDRRLWPPAHRRHRLAESLDRAAGMPPHFLTLATGKKIQVPFEQLIIFSTNLEPTDWPTKRFCGEFRTRLK